MHPKQARAWHHSPWGALALFPQLDGCSISARCWGLILKKKKSPKCIYIQQPLPYIWKHKHTVSKTLPSASPKLRFMRRLNHAQKTSMNCTLAQCHPYLSSRLGHADLHVQLILRNRILYLLLLVERNAPLHFHENEARLSHFETSIFYVESPNANQPFEWQCHPTKYCPYQTVALTFMPQGPVSARELHPSCAETEHLKH